MKSRHPNSGVTLVELLVVMTIVGILVSIAVPSYRYATATNRISGEINALLGDVQFARYEAIKEGLAVTICPPTSATSEVCDNASTTWNTGWIVQANVNSNLGAVVLRRQPAFSKSNSNDSLSGSTGVGPLSFNREGFLKLATPAMFTLRDPTSNAGFTRCLMVSVAGAVSSTTSGNSLYGMNCTT
jgi:type IV fimbrial biogenesis protein FimT